MASTQTRGAGRPKAKGKKAAKRAWQAPTIDDVSAKILAQPYIRFT